MRFYLNRSGQPEGPLEEAAIIEMVQRGEVPAAAYVCPEGGQAWQPLASHPPFAPQPAATKPVAATVAMDSATFQQALAAAPAPGGFAPPMTPSPAHGYSTPGGFAPAAPARSPAQPKSKVGLLIGGGCGLVSLLAICVGGGTAAYFMTRGSELAETVNHTAEDMLLAAQGRPTEGHGLFGNSGGAEPTLMETSDEARTTLVQVGDAPEIVLTGVELSAIAGAQRVRAIVVVFPDGEVRYSGLRAEPHTGSFTQLRSFPRAYDAQRHLAEGVDALLDGAADDCDSLELLERDQLSGLPSELVDDIMRDTATADRQELCDAVAQLGRSAFTLTMVGEITTIVGQNGRHALVRSRFAVSGSDPDLAYLEPVRVRIVGEAPPAPREEPVTNANMDPRTVEPCVTECGGAQNTTCWQPCLDRRAAEINRRALGTP